MNKSQLAIAAVVLLLGLLWSPRIADPFFRHHEFNGVFYGNIARNYLHYGLSETLGGQITNTYRPVSAQNWNLHTHHPPTYPLLLAGSIFVLGDSEFTLRLVSLIASLAGIVGLYFVLTKLRISLWPRILALLAVGTTPLLLYYTTLPVFELIIFPLVVWTIYFWLRGTWRLVILGVFLAALVDWPGYWLGVFIWLAHFYQITESWIREKKIKIDWSQPRYRSLVWLPATLMLSVAIFAIHTWSLGTESWERFWSTGGSRLSFADQPYTIYEWVRRLVSQTRAFWGLPLLLASVWGCWLMVKQKYFQLLIALIGIAVIHILVFRNIAWYHDYMLLHSIPLVAVASGIGLQSIWTRSKTLALIIWSIAIFWQLWSTQPFYSALVEMEPHRSCVEFGKQLNLNPQNSVFIASQEDTKICPPFIGYYGQQPFTTQIPQ